MVTRNFYHGLPALLMPSQRSGLAESDFACHIARMRLGIGPLALTCAAALVLSAAKAQETTKIVVVDRDTLSPQQVYGREVPLRKGTHELLLTLVYFTGGDWSANTILGTIREAVEILAQCDVFLRKLEIVRIDAPSRYRYFSTPISRELARTLGLSKPTVYFVTDTRQQPAFDAEAIGRGNSKSRPELADTVWVTRATRDAGIALAHELVHVLMDRGVHVDRPGNLMRDETSPDNTQLTPTQCAQVRDVGAKHELLRGQ